MVDKRKKEDCCGCGACMQTCPKNAIKMEPDDKGFLYPEIDYSLCIECGMCDKVCGFDKDYAKIKTEPLIYAVKHKNDDVRSKSTSGGLFTALSDYALENNGVVFGVTFDKDLSVIHSMAENDEKRNKFRGSKYVQSNILNTYKEAKEQLEEGKIVVFTGTPCQISGLRTYLTKDYENLFTVDLLCHGVPSNKLWLEFIKIVEKRAKDKVENANFRDKNIGWGRSTFKFYYKNRKTNVHGERSFSDLFYLNVMLRESCYNCKFRSYARPSDITIADFWGIDSFKPEINDDKGMSLAMINSDKGKKLFDIIKEKVDCWESDKKYLREDQITGKVTRNEKADVFWEDYFKRGIKYVAVKYAHYSKIETFFFKVKRRIKIIFKL